MMVDDDLTGWASDDENVFERLRLEREVSVSIESLTLADAYEEQSRVIQSRIAQGEKHVGWKIGCTSRAIQAEFGLSNPIRGHLMAPHVHPSPVSLDLNDYVACAVEPEFVIRVGSSMRGAGMARDEIRSKIDSIAPGIEVHNYRFFLGPPTSQELIVSNGLHAGLVHGDFVSLDGNIDLDLEGIGVFVNGRLAASGIGAEIMGSVLASMAWLLDDLAQVGKGLSAGELVIPGSPVNLVPVYAGDVVESRFTNFGGCRVEFVDRRAHRF